LSERSRVKVRREIAKNRKTKITSSPKNPRVPPAGPPTGEIPLVANVDIAWQIATSGGSPRMISAIQSASVSPP
jgi:hypothetical protein